MTLSRITSRTFSPITLDDLGPTCSIEEAAGVLGLGKNYAYQLARQGEFPGLLVLGRRLRVSVPALRRYLGVDEDAV